MKELERVGGYREGDRERESERERKRGIDTVGDGVTNSKYKRIRVSKGRQRERDEWEKGSGRRGSEWETERGRGVSESTYIRSIWNHVWRQCR